MEDDLNFFKNLRQPQFFKDQRQPQFFKDRRRPQFFQKWKMVPIFIRWKTTKNACLPPIEGLGRAELPVLGGDVLILGLFGWNRVLQFLEKDLITFRYGHKFSR